LRRWLLLNQNAAHASSAQVDCERQADRACADDKDLRIQSNIPQRLRIENAITLSTGAEAAHASTRVIAFFVGWSAERNPRFAEAKRPEKLFRL
jgi:hypothetical protein